MSWMVLFVNAAAEAELNALPEDMQMRFARITDMFRDFGLKGVHEPYVKHVEDKLWEMRLKGKDGIARSIYVAAQAERVIVLRTFVKKTEKTPRREIEIAFQRMKEITP
jgi:phage-related protein